MRELTPELIVDRVIPRDPRLSPDGRLAVWVAAPASRREEHGTSALWLADAASGAPARQVTRGSAEDQSPRWAPDGTAVYFLSDRDERSMPRLYRLPIGGGEAEPLTPGEVCVGVFAVAPDGACVAYAAPADTREEEERRRRERDDAAVYGERWDRHRLRLLDLRSGDVKAFDLGERHVAGIAWSPAGDRLAVALYATPRLDEAWNGFTLALVDPADGSARELGRHVGDAATLAWAPAGDAVLFVGPEAGRRPSSNSLRRVETATGDGRCLTVGLNGCVVGLTQPARADRALVLVAEGVGAYVATVDVVTGERTEVHRPARGVVEALAADAAGDRLLVVASAADEPPEVHALDRGGDPRRLTDHGAPLREVAWGRQAAVEWKAPDGWTIDGLLITPPERRGDGTMPLICYVHGGPYGRFADGFNVTWAQWLAAQGWAVLMPNPRGGLGRGHAFADTVAGEVGNADFLDVMAGVDAMVERSVADPDRLAIGGWSQGGFMTAWAIGQPAGRRFKAGVMGAGVSDWGMMTAESDMTEFELMLGGDAPWDGAGPHRHQRQSPISYARHASTPLLILHGEKDERVPVSQGRLMGMALRRLGVPVEEVVYPREPHGIRERNHQLDILRRLAAWYRRWL